MLNEDHFPYYSVAQKQKNWNWRIREDYQSSSSLVAKQVAKDLVKWLELISICERDWRGFLKGISPSLG